MSVSRRQFLAAGTAGLASILGLGFISSRRRDPVDPLLVNDMHAQLNGARVSEVLHPSSLEDLIGIVRRASRDGKPLSICGSRHAMGGQQFAAGATLVDTRGMSGVIDLDVERGIVDVEAGTEWPDLVSLLLAAQDGSEQPWTIPMKQTGADKLTIGGAVAANAHGRTLDKKPFIGDVESLLLVTATGEVKRCSRSENSELFRLVIGGYGLFGIVHSVQMRLMPREKVERTVEVISIDDLIKGFDDRLAAGYTSGDFQFVTDEKSDRFLSDGVFSCYRPVPLDTPIPKGQKKISERAWNELVYLAHTDKERAFRLYSDYYLGTSGQVYWSDTSQLGGYAQDYHQVLDRRMRSPHPGSEMITELYVPRAKLSEFMNQCAESLRRDRASVIYGTIRLIRKDDESFLAWAKDDYACVIFNLHVDHTHSGLDKAASAFRGLIQNALNLGGSYYLTYHRWASEEQVERAYPQFREFLAKKREFDSGEVFQSDWYRHYREMFA